MSRLKNRSKDKFLNSAKIEESESEKERELDHVKNKLSKCMKFNFSYFVGESPGYDFHNLSQEKLADLFTKMRDYCRENLDFWEREAIGSSGTVFANYIDFPVNSDFSEPAHTPRGVSWGRFRIDSKTRLAGFVVPKGKHDLEITKGNRLDSNVFYVVFLDNDHVFYKTKKR
jgi:hypothetical protein